MYSPQQFLDGVYLLIDKPKGWTSFDVIGKIRFPISKYCNVKKIKVGHSGTLDPMATGLLLIATGKFTKKLKDLQNLDKLYSGTIKLGATTPSYDAETKIDMLYSIKDITEEKIFEAQKYFIGTIDQVPPVYSSIKVEGVRSYKKARDGEDFELNARKITIYKFIINNIQIPYLQFSVACSKGTYIRSLAHDFGKKLNCGAYLTELRRDKVGDFSLSDATNINDFLKSLEQ